MERPKDSPRRRNVLICGATGFIGRNLVERLAASDDWNVTAIVHRTPAFAWPGVKWVEADLRRQSDVERVLQGMDVVIQAAATTSGARDIVQRPHLHVTDNALMNSLIFRAAHELEIRHVVFFSCTVMYGSSESPLKETDFNANREMFPAYFGVGWTKVYLEKMAEFYSRLGRTRYSILRHSNIYGPWDKYDLERSHVFGATVAKVLGATDGRVPVWGDGSEERDLLHVFDLVDCVERLLERQTESFELCNVGAGKPISIRSLVERVIALSGRSLEIEYQAGKPSLKTRVHLDISRVHDRYGWSPKISLDEGILKTLAWCRAHVFKAATAQAPRSTDTKPETTCPAL